MDISTNERSVSRSHSPILYFVFTLLAFLVPVLSQAIHPNTLPGWSLLELVHYHYAWSDEWEMEVPVPVFPSPLQEREGSEYTLSGYYIPVELEEKEIFLSKSPYSSCFFCGGAGPETVAEVHFAEEVPAIQLDAVVTVKGTLRLNTDDYAHLFFILEEAELVKQE